MEPFSYKGGYEVTHIEHLKEEFALATHEWLWVISNTMLCKTVMPVRN